MFWYENAIRRHFSEGWGSPYPHGAQKIHSGLPVGGATHCPHPLTAACYDREVGCASAASTANLPPMPPLRSNTAAPCYVALWRACFVLFMAPRILKLGEEGVQINFVKEYKTPIPGGSKRGSVEKEQNFFLPPSAAIQSVPYPGKSLPRPEGSKSYRKRHRRVKDAIPRPAPLSGQPIQH